MLAGKKSFGEKIARKIEDRLGLPRGSLDVVDGASAAPPATENLPASPEAMMLAHLFDELPADDLIARATAHNAATAAILAVLSGLHSHTTAAPAQAAKTKKQRA